MNSQMMKVLWRKHKTALIVGAGSIAVVALLLVSAAVGTAYLAIKNVSAQTDFDWKQKVDKLNPTDQNLAFITELTLSLTRQTLTQSLESGDLVTVIDGIACVDSIGGPNPKMVINHIRSKTSNELLTSRLAEVEQALNSGISRRGSGQCLNWLING